MASPLFIEYIKEMECGYDKVWLDNGKRDLTCREGVVHGRNYTSNNDHDET